jgi:hypothetical protein
MNLEACAAIRRTMDEQTGQPDVKLIIPEHGGPPSVVYEPLFDTYAEQHDPAKWDRQARSSSSGKYIRTRRAYTPSIVKK